AREHRLAAGGAVANGSDGRAQMHGELSYRGEREHLVRRLQLNLEWLPIGKQRWMGVAVDQAGHYDAVRAEVLCSGGSAGEFRGAAYRRNAASIPRDNSVMQRWTTVAIDQQPSSKSPVILQLR